MSSLHKLATSECIIYIATRLFDHAEKIKAEDIEQAVLKAIYRAMDKTGVVPKEGVRPTFVPYRDTAQNVDDTPNPETTDLNQTIYSEDVERLNRSFALVGFYDGLSKDEGVSMEIGYAYGLKLPIILAMSDFVRAGFKNVLNSEHLVDPVIEAMASKIIYHHNIPRVETSFKGRLQAALKALYSEVEKETYSLCVKSVRQIGGSQENNPTTSSVQHDVCIDFGAGLFEWQRILQNRLAERLVRMGLSCTIGDRYSYFENHRNNIPISKLGLRDISKVQSSRVLVTCSDSTEMSSGTAALQGYARAIGKKVLLYDSKTIDMVGDNYYKSSRNLMIDYSANVRVSSFDDLAGAVESLLT